MISFFTDIFQLLVVPPGNLAYSLFLTFSLAWAFTTSFNHYRASEFAQARRATIGLGIVLLAQVMMFICAGLAQASLLPAHIIIPPVDRGIMLFSLVVFIWLWGLPEPSAIGDAIAISMGLLVIAFSSIGLMVWSAQGANLPFNNSLLDTISSLAAALVSAIGILVLAIRRPNNWGIGLGMLLLNLAGSLVHYWFAPLPEFDYAGAIRLAQMAAYPLLLTLPLRFPLPTTPSPTPTIPLPSQEKRRFNSDPKILYAYLELASERSLDKAYRNITATVSKMMLADLVFLVRSNENNRHLNVACGYDLIRERPLDGFALDERLSPIITSALRRGRAARLPASSTSPDLLGFATALNLGRVGHMLVIPLPVNQPDERVGIVLLSPYSNRGWSADDQMVLGDLSNALGRFLQQIHSADGENASNNEAAQPASSLHAAHAELEQLRKQNLDLVARLEEAQQNAQQAQAQAASLAGLIDQQNTLAAAKTNSPAEQSALPTGELEDLKQAREQLRLTLEEIAILRTENMQVKTSTRAVTESASREIGQLEEHLRISLEEITRLNERLFEADQKLMEKQIAESETPPADNAEVIASLAQDLRQPMSSIIGYTDLLLGESVGILGAMQRKFIDRIKAATERMGCLIEDLVRLTIAEKDRHELKAESVNLGAAIDEALMASLTQFREKNIALRVDLPAKLPQVSADHDALQQVLLHLLQNAGMASPADGEIALRARVEETNQDASYVLVQVTDSGEGVPAEDMPRVFARRYRADNPLVPGVGDTGVGLSIVKSLVEAQGGRIWVDSVVGRGSTFSVLLPLAAPASKEKPR